MLTDDIVRSPHLVCNNDQRLFNVRLTRSIHIIEDDKSNGDVGRDLFGSDGIHFIILVRGVNNC